MSNNISKKINKKSIIKEEYSKKKNESIITRTNLKEDITFSGLNENEKEEVRKGNYDSWNLEEEDLEEEDYYYEDDNDDDDDND